MNLKNKLIIIILISVVGASFWFRGDIKTASNNILDRFFTFQDSIKSIVKENKEILTPGPLRSSQDSSSAFLTRQGVINWTNQQRKQSGLPPLVENLKLNSSASVKVQDMLAKQYFEHISPLGVSVSDLATRAGYQYLSIGENLALGNFKNDQVLVQAWMDSPGHRANILNTKYKEIGVAVIKGQFEGRTTWLAVQHFGLPETACPAIDQSLKQKLDARSVELDNIKHSLDIMQAEIDNMRPKRGEEYNRKVDEYNALIKEYNRLLDEQKIWIAQYNNQVNEFNSCLESYK